MLEAMKAGRHSPLRATIAVVGLALTLLILALLQYRWINQVSRSHRERMQAAMVTAVRQFQAELSRELFTLGAAFRPDFRAGPDARGVLYANRWDAWRAAAAYPDLLENVFVAEGLEPNEARIFQLDPSREQLTPLEWPERLNPARRYLSRGARDGARGFPRPFARPVLIARIALLMIPLPPRPVERRFFRGGARPLSGYLLLELDRTFLKEQMLPELATRHFSGEPGFVYDVAVLFEQDAGAGSNGRPSSQVLYASSPGLVGDSFADAEMRVPLLFDPEMFARRGPDRDAGPRDRSDRRGGRRGFRRGRPPLLAAADGRWVLAVKHLGGSLDAVAESFRRRNLAVGLGILLVLGLTMGMILVSSNRAQRLAKLQMDFVAGVSHELKTPLAVIRSAADNLAAGVVDSPEKIREYGVLIRNHGRRLSMMVEQTLRFAASEADSVSYDLRPLAPAEAVQTALEETSAAIKEAGFTVDTQIEEDLPVVSADPRALGQILENLINNALKYGGKAKWMGVRASASSSPNGSGDGLEVHFAIEDRGLGIERRDLAHIFDPFYRGRVAQDAQIQGAGLGLSLARDTAQAMGGGLTVTSALGKGSLFTLTLPAAVDTRPRKATG